MPFFTRDQLYSTNNRKQLRLWFIEYQDRSPVTAVLNYSYEDGYKGTKCLKDIYMQFCVEDPTETNFAEHMFGDVSFWLDVRDEPWVKEFLPLYRKEADTRRKAMAFKAIIKEVKTGSRSAFTAAKFLIDEPWLQGATATEKKEIARRKRETSAEASEASRAVEDFKRLMSQKAN